MQNWLDVFFAIAGDGEFMAIFVVKHKKIKHDLTYHCAQLCSRVKTNKLITPLQGPVMLAWFQNCMDNNLLGANNENINWKMAIWHIRYFSHAHSLVL